MNTANNLPPDNIDLSIETSTTELQRQISESIDRLSPERLHVLADFAAYLVNAESEAATQELLAIPGLLERVQHNQATPKSSYVNWRNFEDRK
jgi:adenine specific DNA methylase Mod